MRLDSGKYILVAVLTLALLLSPVSGLAAHTAAGNISEDAATGSAFQQSASFLGSMFNSTEHAAGSLEGKESLFDPLLNSLEELLRFFTEDEELKEVLGVVLDEIMEDERIANYDADALVVRTLRDERLVEILGSVIGRHLGDENFLGAVERLTGDLSAFLKDPAIVSSLHDIIIDLLHDGRVNDLVFEIACFMLVYADQVKTGIGDGRLESSIDSLTNDLLVLFEAPLLKYSDKIAADKRIDEALCKITDTLNGLDKKFIENLKSDEDLNSALSELEEIFMGSGDEGSGDSDPGLLSTISDTLIEQLKEDLATHEALEYLIDLMVAEATDFGGYITDEETGEEVYEGAYETLFPELALLMGDLDAVLEGIGAEVGAVMDHYSEHGPFAEPGETEGDGCTLIDTLVDIDSDEVEDQVSDFLSYWAEVAGWVAGKKIEKGDLEPLINKYFGEDSDFLPVIIEALSSSVESAQEDVTGVLDDHITEFEENLDDLLFGHPGSEDSGLVGETSAEFTELLEEIMEEKLAEMESDEIADLLDEMPGLLGLVEKKVGKKGEELLGEVGGQGETIIGCLLESLKGAIENIKKKALPSSSSKPGGNAGEEDLLSLLNEIVPELPFEVLADLIDEADVKELLSGLSDLVDGLPLGTAAPYLRKNADELGYTIASSLLNGIADSIEFPEPEDPRVTAIMELMQSETRLRQFYLDLGGVDPDTITAESSPGSIILAVLLEIAGDQDRIDRFSEHLEQQSKPVTDDILYYGRGLGDWILGSLRSFAHPFFKRAFASFLIFTPRGHDDHFQSDPFEWLDYERFAVDASTGGALVGELLTESMAASFVDESMYSFLVEHEAVADFASPQRLGVIHYFFSEMADAEPLKELKAGDSTGELYDLVNEGLHRLRSEKLAGAVDPLPLTRSLNSLLVGLLPASPGEVFSFSIESLSLTARDIVQGLTGPLDDAAPELREKVDDLVQPLADLPADLLDDPEIKEAKDALLAGIPGIPPELAAKVLEDERLDDLLTDKAALLVGKMTDEALDLVDGVVNDPDLEGAIEDAVVTILTGNDLPHHLGDLAQALLEDALLLDFVEDLISASRIIAVGGYSCTSGSYYKPDSFMGGPSPTHELQQEEDVPSAFDFKDKNIRVKITFFPQDVKADYYFFEMGCNNGLYLMTEELLNWLDPDKSSPASPTPGRYLKDYLPGVYLEESRVRSEVARPLAKLLAGTLKGFSEEEEREEIKKVMLDNAAAFCASKPLQVIADYMRSDKKIHNLLHDGLAGLPYDDIAGLLRDNPEIRGLFEDAFDTLPLEEATGYLYDNEQLKGIIDDAGLEIDLLPLWSLLKIDQSLPQTLLQRVQAFPVERVRDVLMGKGHLHRIAYMQEDLKGRFISDLLTNPDLIELESALAREKAEAANYSLAQGVAGVAERFVGDRALIDHSGNVVFEFFRSVYIWAKTLLRSLFGLPGESAVEASAAGGLSGSDFYSGVFLNKEVA